LDNYNYSPGDTISGKINLTIKKPVQSKGLSIRLIGERIQTNRVNIGNQKSSTNSQMVFDFKQPVEGAKEYQPGPVVSYDFKIKIPNDVITKLDGVLGAVVKTAQFLSGTNTSVKWYLLSDLDIPGIEHIKKNPYKYCLILVAL